MENDQRRYPIFVTLERGLNVSVKGEHSTHSDSVTNIGNLLSLGAFVLLRNSGLIWLAKSESNVV